MKVQNQHSGNPNALPCVQTPVSGSRFVPMLFSTPMVQAILNGTKTETRRILTKETFLNDLNVKMPTLTDNNSFAHFGDYAGIVSKAKIGDIIWVRETFAVVNEKIIYKASICSPDFDKPKNGWKPSLFMPKKACRLFLEVVSVSVERLQDIDEQSAINEGAISGRYLGLGQIGGSVKEGYFELWDSLNGKSATLINPFVWVYKFRSIPVPPDFC